MNVLSLFSGIGGFDLGLERAGMRTVAFCESDPYCRAVLAKRWPGVPIHEDVRTLPRIDGIDLVCGGVPCQPASLAGKRQGSADERWLWPAFLEVVRASGARWVLAENPIGITSLKPDGLDWICRQLGDAGYDPWPIIVSANDVSAPHLRKRVWIVAHRPGIGRQQEHADSRGRGARAGAARDDRRDGSVDLCATVPDTSGKSLRNEPGRIGGTGGPGTPESGDDGAAKSLADARREYGNGWPHEISAGTSRYGIEQATVHAERSRADVADTDRGRRQSQRQPEHGAEQGALRNEFDGRGARRSGHGAAVGDADGARSQGGAPAAADGAARGDQRRESYSAGWWDSESGICRVAHGIPRRVDRLRTLGNAAVSQNVEIIGQAIMRISV